MAIDNLTLRAILFFLLGGFLLFAGISIDAIGRSINNDGNDRAFPVSPMVLVGGIVLSIGVLMLVAAAYLTYRSYQTKKKRPPYDSTPANAVRLVERPLDNPDTSGLQETRPQSRQSYQPPDIQMTTYAVGVGSANGSYIEENPYSEIKGVSSPAAAALLYHYSANLGTPNPRYSRTLGPSRHGMGRGRLKGGFTPLHPVDEGSVSTYSSEVPPSRYSTLPAASTMENSGYSWRSHLMREQTRSMSRSPRVLSDEPPPYDTQVVGHRETPPPYMP